MTHPTLFSTFLSEIRLSDKEEFKQAHKTLRELLGNDAKLSPLIVGTFLQGSYRRATAIKPEGDSKPDVDVVVATNIDSGSTTPQQAMNKFKAFLDEHYKDNWTWQARSIAVTDGDVELDLVVTSAPSTVTKSILLSEDVQSYDTIESNIERYVKFAQSLYEPVLLSESKSDPWKGDPLLIPDRQAKEWTPTDPIAQMTWTTQKNKDTNGHYVNIVKALKWWKRGESSLPKYPKGYPLEHLIGQNCPDGIQSIAEGIVLTLEAIRDNYQSYVDTDTKPVLSDHGVPEHDVLKRITEADFKKFHSCVSAAAAATREAYDCQVKGDSWKAWYDFFGDPFPKPDEDSTKSMSELLANSSANPRTERFG